MNGCDFNAVWFQEVHTMVTGCQHTVVFLKGRVFLFVTANEGVQSHHCVTYVFYPLSESRVLQHTHTHTHTNSVSSNQCITLICVRHTTQLQLYQTGH